MSTEGGKGLGRPVRWPPSSGAARRTQRTLGIIKNPHTVILWFLASNSVASNEISRAHSVAALLVVAHRLDYGHKRPISCCWKSAVQSGSIGGKHIA